MAKIRCVGRYVNDPRNLAFNVGEVFELDDATWAYLQTDAPGCFEVVPDKPPRRKRVRKPPMDKAVQSAEVEK